MQPVNFAMMEQIVRNSYIEEIAKLGQFHVLQEWDMPSAVLSQDARNLIGQHNAIAT